jgi:prepilin peptidase CpaA
MMLPSPAGSQVRLCPKRKDQTVIATKLLLSLALAFAAAAALYDLRTGQIPNRLTLPGLAAGALLQLLALCLLDRPPGESLAPATFALIAARVAFGVLACGLVPYLLFLRNGMGGGDVKLLAAIGGLLGPVLGLEVELYAFVTMALFAPARLAYEGRLFRVLSNSAALLINPLLPAERRREVPAELLSSFKFAPAVFAASVLVALLRWRSA